MFRAARWRFVRVADNSRGDARPRHYCVRGPILLRQQMSAKGPPTSPPQANEAPPPGLRRMSDLQPGDPITEPDKTDNKQWHGNRARSRKEQKRRVRSCKVYAHRSEERR